MVPTAGNGHISSNGPSIPDGSWDREAWPPTNQSDADLVEHASPKESNASIGSRPSLEELDAIVRNQSLDDRNNATIANPQPEETTPETCSVQDNRPAPRGSPIPTKQSHSVVQPRTFGKDSQEISILEKRSSYQRITDFITRFWLFEVGSITVSVAVLIAIAIILKNSDGYQISTGNNEPDNWFFGQLTLNGLIALLSTVVEACMMISVAASISQLKWIHFSARRSMQNGHKLAEFDDMDQASRGARGSLKLLLSRAPQLTSVGAIITIFALAFDTFSQQVIAIESAIGNQTQPADIPAVASYSLYMKNGQEGRFFAPLSITAAIYNGVYDPGNISPSPVQCLTGNCTWSVFPSLAVDGSCTNITDTVIHDCEPTENAYNCTYNVANGSGYSFSQTSSSPLGVGGYHGAEYRLIVNPSFTGSAYNDPHILYILQFLVLDLTGGPGLRAYACGLWLSVHAYNLTMVSGKQTQTFTGIWTKTHYATQKEKGSEAWYSFIDLPTSVSPPNVPETERILDSSILSSNPPNVSTTAHCFSPPNNAIVQFLGLSICLRRTPSCLNKRDERIGCIWCRLVCAVL